MRTLLFLLFPIVTFGQITHGFTYQNGLYEWKHSFPTNGRNKKQTQDELISILASNPYVRNLTPLDGRIAGRVENLVDSKNATNILMPSNTLFSFGFTALISDSNYIVTTKNWNINVQMNMSAKQLSMTLEKALKNGKASEKNQEKALQPLHDMQITMFGL